MKRKVYFTGLTIVGFCLWQYSNFKINPIIQDPYFLGFSANFFVFALILELINFWLKKGFLKKVSFAIMFLFFLFSASNAFKAFGRKSTEELNLEYDKYESCEALFERFNIDRNDEKFVYFSYGMATDYRVSKELFKKYKIRVLPQGCQPNFRNCYNQKVEEYFLKKNNKSIFDGILFEEDIQLSNE